MSHHNNNLFIYLIFLEVNEENKITSHKRSAPEQLTASRRRVGDRVEDNREVTTTHSQHAARCTGTYKSVFN